jgi:hypothetical protein
VIILIQEFELKKERWITTLKKKKEVLQSMQKILQLDINEIK